MSVISFTCGYFLLFCLVLIFGDEADDTTCEEQYRKCAGYNIFYGMEYGHLLQKTAREEKYSELMCDKAVVSYHIAIFSPFSLVPCRSGLSWVSICAVLGRAAGYLTLNDWCAVNRPNGKDI